MLEEDGLHLLTGRLKFRDGKKWKARLCEMRRLSPAAGEVNDLMMEMRMDGSLDDRGFWRCSTVSSYVVSGDSYI